MIALGIAILAALGLLLMALLDTWVYDEPFLQAIICLFQKYELGSRMLIGAAFLVAVFGDMRHRPWMKRLMAGLTRKKKEGRS
ncbi:hypothetical protein RB620_06545 [Paenibacillus sp. LHD-117]|uniref:hypothetical protein n=1 Tax=Paenibacillus sp. LHD-117 TaxID=3071412 RepID=UPI0027E1C077|nr:hypothetical protein [Paenibacillus sp. LHD-117]MDQ6419095.1 hypothetical protein [Paenibacillus sp. LHD-117]